MSMETLTQITLLGFSIYIILSVRDPTTTTNISFYHFHSVVVWKVIMTHVTGIPLIDILLFIMQIININEQIFHCENDSNIMNILIICPPRCSLSIQNCIFSNFSHFLTFIVTPPVSEQSLKFISNENFSE